MKQLLKKLLGIVYSYLGKQKWYQWCQENDIYAHLIGGFILTLLTILYCFLWGFKVAFIVSLLGSSLLFFCKELGDMIKPNPTGFDWNDIKADYAGWIIGTWFSFVVYGIIKLISISL